MVKVRSLSAFLSFPNDRSRFLRALPRAFARTADARINSAPDHADWL
jgi:hypothetical protein